MAQIKKPCAAEGDVEKGVGLFLPVFEGLGEGITLGLGNRSILVGPSSRKKASNRVGRKSIGVGCLTGMSALRLTGEHIGYCAIV